MCYREEEVTYFHSCDSWMIGLFRFEVCCFEVLFFLVDDLLFRLLLLRFVSIRAGFTIRLSFQYCSHLERISWQHEEVRMKKRPVGFYFLNWNLNKHRAISDILQQTNRNQLRLKITGFVRFAEKDYGLMVWRPPAVPTRDRLGETEQFSVRILPDSFLVSVGDAAKCIRSTNARYFW